MKVYVQELFLYFNVVIFVDGGEYLDSNEFNILDVKWKLN